jgi:hypothetical protein
MLPNTFQMGVTRLSLYSISFTIIKATFVLKMLE